MTFKISGQPRRELKKKLAKEKQFMKYFFVNEDLTATLGGYTYGKQERADILCETKMRIEKYEQQLKETV
jgi:flagellar biosynthesis/type III secretory pathway ATPase